MAFVIANIELFAAFAGVASLLGLTYSLESMLGYQPTLPGDAVRLMNDGANVLDLRPATEFAAGHIGTAVNLAPTALADWVGKQRKSNKTKQQRPVLLITAPRQSVFGVARQLRAQGFEQIHVLKGGMRGWGDAQLPQVK